ncbi:MAG: hypothetical protein IIA05_05230 [Proteobacteria bacterium]|nr:hypothetical protein [Pseudomonadota bacterium]
MKKMKISHLASLFMAAFLLTAANIIIVPDAAFAAPPPCKGLNKDDPGCDGGGGGPTFTVDILGDGLVGGSSGVNPWLQSFGGQNSIGLNDASGLDVGSLTGLRSFTGQDADCFPEILDGSHATTFPLHQAIVKQGKKGSAEASFWFHGATDDGSVPLVYVLKLFGDFDGENVEFPGTATLSMVDEWELKVENEGKKIKDLSCESQGTGNDVTITVTELP